MFRFVYSVCDFKFNPFKVILKIPFKSSGCMLYHIHYKKMVEIQSVCDNEKYLLISWFVSNVLHTLQETSRDHLCVNHLLHTLQESSPDHLYV